MVDCSAYRGGIESATNNSYARLGELMRRVGRRAASEVARVDDPHVGKEMLGLISLRFFD